MICTMQHVSLVSVPVPYRVLFEAFYRSLINPEYFGRIMNYRDPDYAFSFYEATPSVKHTVLDVGCACSYFVNCLACLTPNVHGIDLIDSYAKIWAVPWLETMKDFECYRSGNVRITQANAAVLPFPDAYFDTVYTISALEHFADEDELACVREIYRVLKPGGVLVGTVDYNEATEKPQGADRLTRAYTHEAFHRRVVEPSGLKLSGIDHLEGSVPASSVEYATTPLFFKLAKV